MQPVFIALKYLWLFFSGGHLDGKTYNDSTWWRDASPRYKTRRLAYTWWRRKARLKRAAWRGCIFWTTIAITLSAVFYTSYLEMAILAISPLLIWFAFKRARLLLYNPVVQTLSDGTAVQHWIQKPKLARTIRRVKRLDRKRPGLARHAELAPSVRMRPIPSEYRQAVTNELAEELEGQPPIELKLLMSPGDE